KRSVWLKNLVLLAVPIAAVGSIQAWSTWGLNQSPLPAAAYDNYLWQSPVGLRRAGADFFLGLTPRSFLGVFCLLDAPLVFDNMAATRVVSAVIHVVSLLFVGLTLVRFVQVSTRLLRVYRKGRRVYALRLLVANPVYASYFLFTALMIVLFVCTDNV